jgi:drug/metabolite transporter (DMT)-like permease
VKQRSRGIYAALASALFLGLTPIFGKQAILLGLPPLATAALRTVLAAALLALVMLLFSPRSFYIYPAGLLGCLIAGGVNGVGSLLFYAALGRIDAGMGQVLYAAYPLFVALWMRLDGQAFSRLTLLRLGLTLPALLLLLHTGGQAVDLVGVLLMLGASALYALHLPINQRVLYDMPAPTVTLYTLIAMSAVVFPAFLVASLLNNGLQASLQALQPAAGALAGLTLVTFFSRLMLFLGVKHLGGLQTAMLGLTELLVTLSCAHLLLGERLTAPQWAGVALLVCSLMLAALEKVPVHQNKDEHVPLPLGAVKKIQ